MVADSSLWRIFAPGPAGLDWVEKEWAVTRAQSRNANY